MTGEASGLLTLPVLIVQKGEDPEVLAAKKREMEAKRAAAASKSTKTFYKVTVKVQQHCTPAVTLSCKRKPPLFLSFVL